MNENPSGHGRTELAALIHQAMGIDGEINYRVADAVIAAGWLPPGTIKRVASDTLSQGAPEERH